MKRGQKAAAQSWGAIAKQRADSNKDKKMETKEVVPEEHEKRIKAFKEMGLIK